LLRAVRGLGYVSLLLALFEACSGNDTSSPTPPPGPAHVEITQLSLGHGFYSEDDEASQVLACDNTIGINVVTNNWTLYPPGRCAGALQCGHLRVSLLDAVSPQPVLTLIAAGNGVALNVLAANPPLPRDDTRYSYTVRVELVDDSGKPYVEVDGGDGTGLKRFDMEIPSATGCPSSGSGGSGGNQGMGGKAGTGGDNSVAGMSGAGGDQAGAEAGNAGEAENAGGSLGSAGSSGGSSGTAGSTGGDQAIGGSSGSAGSTAGSPTGGAPQP